MGARYPGLRAAPNGGYLSREQYSAPNGGYLSWLALAAVPFFYLFFGFGTVDRCICMSH